MARIVLGVIAGFFAWAIVWVASEKILSAIWPEGSALINARSRRPLPMAVSSQQTRRFFSRNREGTTDEHR